MKFGNLKIFILLTILYFIKILPIFAADKIESVPLVNLEDLSPTFEEDKEILEKIEDKSTTLDNISDTTEEIEVQKDDNHTNKIKIDDSIMMEMKYPSLEQFIKNNFDFNEKNMMDQSFDLIATCIDKVYTEDEVWTAADCTKKEMKDFLEQMNSNQFKEIEKFFETMPKLSHSVSVTNPNTKVKSDVVLEGLASFFA